LRTYPIYLQKSKAVCAVENRNAIRAMASGVGYKDETGKHLSEYEENA